MSVLLDFVFLFLLKNLIQMLHYGIYSFLLEGSFRRRGFFWRGEFTGNKNHPEVSFLSSFVEDSVVGEKDREIFFWLRYGELLCSRGSMHD